MPIVGLFPRIYSTLHGGVIELDFYHLLYVITSEGLIIGILIRFDDNNSDCFCTLKILVDSLVLFLSKNVSILKAKSAWPIFTPGQ